MNTESAPFTPTHYFLRSYHGGLGDELQFSHLPERLVKQGHHVHLYTGPDVMPFRNPEIQDLLYTRNPYITPAPADTPQVWNLGDIPGKPYSLRPTGSGAVADSFIKSWSQTLGFDFSDHFPKVYYKANPVSVKGYGLIDLSSKTLQYDTAAVIETCKRLVNLDSPHCDGYFIVNSPHQSNRIKFFPAGHEGISTEVDIENIYQLIDLIFSCRHLITLNSGTHALAAAYTHGRYLQHDSILPKKESEWILRDKKFIFPGVKYHVEGA